MKVSGQLHAPPALTPEKQLSVTIVCWIHPRACLGSLEKREILRPSRESNFDSSAVHPIAQSL
jgi:hypothetical protein